MAQRVPAGGEADLPDAAIRSPQQRPQRAAPDPQVRIHVETSAAGLCLWLGLDGPDGAARAAALLPELRRHLETPSQRLVAFVCNGQPIYRNPDPFQEKT